MKQPILLDHLNALGTTTAQRAAGGALAILVGSILLTLSAKVQIPFWPVPMTMQTFVVMVIGLGYGSRLGVATVGCYLLQGGLGLPVFAHGGGMTYFLGPTGGFLVGMLIAALLLGKLAEHGWGRTFISALVACSVADALVFLSGGAWLATIIGPGDAIASGVLPFLFGDALKVCLAALAVAGASRLTTKHPDK